MEFEQQPQHSERSPELDEAIRHQFEKKLERHLRDMVNERLQSWYQSQVDRHGNELQKEADRIFTMIIEGNASPNAIEEEPKKLASTLALELKLV